jgi:hypothetical protein
MIVQQLEHQDQLQEDIMQVEEVVEVTQLVLLLVEEQVVEEIVRLHTLLVLVLSHQQEQLIQGEVEEEQEMISEAVQVDQV